MIVLSCVPLLVDGDRVGWSLVVDVLTAAGALFHTSSADSVFRNLRLLRTAGVGM